MRNQPGNEDLTRLSVAMAHAIATTTTRVDISNQGHHPIAMAALRAFFIELEEMGGAVVFPDNICWEDIHRYEAALRMGQDIHEDGGGFFARCIRVLMRTPVERDRACIPYQTAVKAMLEGANASLRVMFRHDQSFWDRACEQHEQGKP